MASIQLHPSFVIHLCNAAVKEEDEIIAAYQARIDRRIEEHNEKVASMSRLARFFFGRSEPDPWDEDDINDHFARSDARARRAKIQKIITLAHLAEQQDVKVTMTEQDLKLLQDAIQGASLC